MTRPGRQNRSGGARGGWIDRERGEAGFAGRTRTIGRRRTRCGATGRLAVAAAMPKHRRPIRPERSPRKRPPPASTIASVLHGGKPHGRAPGGGPGPSAGHDWRKRRSGIVRRPVAPDTARRGWYVLKGTKPHERRLTGRNLVGPAIRSRMRGRAGRRWKRSGGCRFEGSARSARLGRLLRQDPAVTGEDAEAQAKKSCAA